MKKKILVVDDDKRVRGYLSKVLSEADGFFVDLAETAEVFK
jgi:DNA-binding response OmpR family regulator